MKILKRIRGWIRLYIWGVCPKCNHDAPELYTCTVCGYYKYLQRYREDQTKFHRKEVWKRFKKHLKGTL